MHNLPLKEAYRSPQTTGYGNRIVDRTSLLFSFVTTPDLLCIFVKISIKSRIEFFLSISLLILLSTSVFKLTFTLKL